MTQGTSRRDQVQDSLKGALPVQPTTRTAPSVTSSATQGPASVLNPTTARTIQAVQGWTSKEVRNQIASKRERDVMEGQVAFQQGKTFDEVEMEGDKFALQGYRVMQAQTASAAILSQQQAAIRDGGYEDTPEDFRSKYGAALEESIKDLDPTTGAMVREQMTRQMPQLVQSHMTMHLADQERKAYSALSTSIDIMSQDDTADSELFSNAAGGELSPSGGLSTARRTAAVVDGITLAFNNGNPKAYAKLQKQGLLDNLDVGQLSAIKRAEASYLREQAKGVNEDWIKEESSVIDRIVNGELSPEDALNAYVTAATAYNVEVTAAQGKAVYLSAKDAQRYEQEGDTVLIQEAALRNDYETIAALTEPMMVQMESGGDPNAVSPVGALGTHQVMPATIADPGYGIEPADITDPKDVARVGKEYWALMVSGEASGYEGLNWPAGDVEAAAIAYNAGPANAKKWIDAGRDYSVLPKREETEPYAKGILAKARGAGAIPPKDRLVAAQALKERTSERLAMRAYEAYQFTQMDLNKQLSEGSLTDREYVLQSNRARQALGVERTKATADHLKSQMQAVRDKAAAMQKGNVKAVTDARFAELQNNFDADMAQPGQPEEYYQRVTQDHVREVASLYSKEGIAVADFNYSGLIDHATKQLNTALDNYDDYQIEQSRIERAASTNTVPTLPKELQERAFKMINDQVGQTVSDAVASGKLSKEEAPAFTRQALEQNYLSVGLVDPQVKAESSAALRGELVNGAGEINTQAKGVIESYIRLKKSDPLVAATLLDNESRVTADAIIAAGGGENSPVQNGMVRYTQSKALIGNVDPGDITVRADTQKRIKRAVEGRFGFGGIVRNTDVGLAQIIFSDAELGDQFNRSDRDEDYLRSSETSEMLQGWLEAEVTAMARLQPGADPKYLVDGARERLTARTDLVGGRFVRMDEGYGIKQQLFGAEVGKYNKADVANEAIMDHLRELSTDPEYSFLTKASFLQALNPFGKDIDSVGDVLQTKLTGVRPFVIVGDGRDVYAQVQLQTGGVSEPIWLDLPSIGQQYKDRYKSKFNKDDVPTER